MVVHRKLLDRFVQRRLDHERYAKGEAAVVMRVIERHDTELVEELRKRLPHLAPGDIQRARAKALMRRVKEARTEAMREAHATLRDHAVELAKDEGEAVGRIVDSAMPIRITYSPIRAATMRAAVTQDPFMGGIGAGRTLSQWFGDMARADQTRLLGAIQHGIKSQETVDSMVRRIAGTRAAKYSDGLMAITRRQAETAVRTAVNHVANAAQVEWGRANADVVSGWQWVAMLDERLCPFCRANRGKFVPNGDSPPPKDMEVVNQTPPLHPNDRCTLVPIIEPERLAGKVADRPEAKPEKTKETGADLTSAERRMLDLMATRASDKKVRAELGLSYEESHAMASGIRGKLGLSNRDSLRAAGQKLRRAG